VGEGNRPTASGYTMCARARLETFGTLGDDR
jgi:hypothetical protein